MPRTRGTLTATPLPEIHTAMQQGILGVPRVLRQTTSELGYAPASCPQEKHTQTLLCLHT